MPGPDTGEVNPLAEVSAWVDSLAPPDIPEELAAVVQHSGDKLLGKMMVQHELSVATGVLDSLEGAVDRIEDPKVQTDLGGRILRHITEGLEHVTPDAVVPYAEYAGYFAGSIAEPREQVRAYIGIVKTTGKAWEAVTNEPPTEAATALGNKYLAKAADIVRSMEPNASTQSSYLSDVAEASVGHVVRTAKFKQSQEGEALLADMVQQPRQLFDEALALAEQIPDPEESLEQQGSIAISVVGAAARLRDVDPEVSKELLHLGLHTLSDIVTDYNSGKGAEVSTAEKATNLGRLGEQLTETVVAFRGVYDRDDQPDGEERANEMLDMTDQVQELFDATLQHGKELSKVYRAGYDENFEGVARTTLRAATELRAVDVNITMNLMSTALELANLEDLIHSSNRGSAVDEVTRSIHEQAKEVSLPEAFKLYALTHMMEAGRIDWQAGQVSQLMVRTVDRWLGRLAEDDTPSVALGFDEVDRQFVEATIRGAVENENSHRYGVEALQKLGDLVRDDRLKGLITEQLHLLEIRRETEEIEKADPGSETARRLKAVVD